MICWLYFDHTLTNIFGAKSKSSCNYKLVNYKKMIQKLEKSSDISRYQCNYFVVKQGTIEVILNIWLQSVNHKYCTVHYKQILVDTDSLVFINKPMSFVQKSDWC